MKTKNQFPNAYNKCVSNIRQIKDNNDQINKAIGIVDSGIIFQDVDKSRKIIQSLFKQVQDIVKQMQKNYMDPDSVRKMVVVRQQLKLQKLRRQQLLFAIPQPPTLQNSRKNNSKNQKNKLNHFSDSQTRAKKYPTSNKSQNNTISYQDLNLKQHLEHIQLEFEQKYLQQRSQQLKQAQQKLNTINNVIKETKHLTHIQGEKIDFIGEQLLIGNQNIQLSNKQLKQANHKSKKWSKKYKIFGIVVLVVVTIAVALSFLL